MKLIKSSIICDSQVSQTRNMSKDHHNNAMERPTTKTVKVSSYTFVSTCKDCRYLLDYIKNIVISGGLKSLQFSTFSAWLLSPSEGLGYNKTCLCPRTCQKSVIGRLDMNLLSASILDEGEEKNYRNLAQVQGFKTNDSWMHKRIQKMFETFLSCQMHIFHTVICGIWVARYYC